MSFDEYGYLDETIENRHDEKFKEIANGSYQMEYSQDKDESRRPKHKIGGSDDESDHQLKRAKTGDESHDREGNRSSSLHHHSSSSNREKSDRERHWHSRDFKDRNRDKDRDEWSRKDRDRDKVKVRDRDGDRRVYERERDREREQERLSRSRSHLQKNWEEWDRETIWGQERSHDVVYKERERPRDLRERDRESRRTKEKKEEVSEPKADPERDQRTVFAHQISLKADERDLYEFFSRAGKVRDVRLIMDRNSRRSKGVGYIEFYDVTSVPMAIALSGQPLLGQMVMVKPSEAKKNLVQSTTSAAAGAGAFIDPHSGRARRLYVGNLNFNIKEDQLRQVFEPFGAVELVQLPSDPETGHYKGYGFVQFARLEDARAALSLDGQLEIAGQVMKVSAVIDRAEGQEFGANACDFDDYEGGCLPLNAESPTLLMQKLNCSGEMSSMPGSPSAPVENDPSSTVLAAPLVGATPVVPPHVAPFGQIPVPALAGFSTAGLAIPTFTVPSFDTIGIPSECLMLKNMFDPMLESEPDFDQDIKEDVEDECSKFGNLKHIYVDKNSTGFVYLRFENTQSAIAAQRALHGRWFAGKMITATFMAPQNYEAKFPVSR